jgi:PAS domain S-box-containing protein
MEPGGHDMISRIRSGVENGCETPGNSSGDDCEEVLKRAFEGLVEREARLNLLADMLFDGTLIVREGVIIEANQGLLSMSGYDASELLGQKIEELDGWQGFGKALAAASGKRVSIETWLPRKRSRSVNATVRAVRVLFSGVEFVLAVVAGITEDEPASESLLRSAERYRSLFQSVSDIIFTKDSNLRFSEVNPAMEKTFGLSASDIVGRSAEQIYGAATGERIRAWDQRVLSGETIEEEHTVLVKGEQLTFHDVRVPIRNSTGEIIGVCGICRNITERKKVPTITEKSSAVFSSKAMIVTMEQAAQASVADCIVLLQGESGTGKDYLAKWIHDHSRRSGSPFLGINCAAVPHEIAESELFGHESGAFTGARGRKRGLLELAEGGTLLLNEIGELSPAVQSKLLVFLDTRSCYRLGGEKPVRVDARIMAATHRSLEEEVQAGRFSEALFYRLNVFFIDIPTLRERVEDIPILASQIISRVAAEMNMAEVPQLDSSFVKTILSYQWPGNIRELRNVIERAMILWQRGHLKLELPSIDLDKQDLSLKLSFRPDRNLRELSREVTKSICLEAVRRFGGNKTAAARALGVSRDSLYRHIKGSTDFSK